ncbi:MAG: hypothetical protein ACREE6_07015, partial [Limisphaerales bacterium]
APSCPKPAMNGKPEKLTSTCKTKPSPQFKMLKHFTEKNLRRHGHWRGAKKAVDEYFAQHAGNVYLHRVDYSARILIKTGAAPAP